VSQWNGWIARLTGTAVKPGNLPMNISVGRLVGQIIAVMDNNG
jgi:hypothetical protein